MKFNSYHSASAYLSKNEDFLKQEEAVNSLLLGLCITKYDEQKDNTFYFDIVTQDDILLTGIQTEGNNLIVYGNAASFEPRVIQTLFNSIEAINIVIRGITGPKDLVKKMADNLIVEHNYTYHIQSKNLIYKLIKIVHNPSIKGMLRKGTMNDLDIVSHWMHLFDVEAFNTDNVKHARHRAKNKIKEGNVFLWQEDSTVSMACIARPTSNGITINYVFTPKECRRKGYGTKLVAELSQLMLNKGYRYCTLLTDLNNSTSNNIYRKIGYSCIGQFITVGIDKIPTNF